MSTHDIGILVFTLHLLAIAFNYEARMTQPRNLSISFHSDRTMGRDHRDAWIADGVSRVVTIEISLLSILPFSTIPNTLLSDRVQS